MSGIAGKGRPPPTQSKKRRKMMDECADKNCNEMATALVEQAKEHPNSQPAAAKKPLSRRPVNRYRTKKNSSIKVNKPQTQTQKRGHRGRLSCCKLAAAKSNCRHRSCKALSSKSSLPTASRRSSKKSSKALANLHNVTTNFVLGVGSQARPEGETIDDANNNFEKLMLSLQSPLPNEHSLTLNTLMILSSVVKDKELNILEKTPALLNMILAHVGFYSDCALRLLMEQSHGDLRDFKAFWQDARSELEDVFQLQRQLLCECFPRDNPDYLDKCCDGCIASQVQVPLIKPPNTALPVGNEKVGRQVQQIGHILRNFSFETGNASKMAMSATMLRFLLMAGTSNHGTLPQISFDIISNITKHIVLMPLASNDKGAIFQLQTIMMDLVTSTFLDSGDRFKILRCLEALQGLALSVGDGEAKLRIFRDMRVLEKLFQFLTLKEDTILVINCLECLLAATAEGMGKYICEKIIESVHGCVATLVSYLTVDVMENLEKTENGFRNDNFRTELLGIEKALDNKSVNRNTFTQVAISEEKMTKSSRIISTSTPKQTPNSSSQSHEKYHIAPSSSFRRKLEPSDEAVTILENVKKIPEGKSITLLISPEALSLLEQKRELQITRLVFPNNHSPKMNSEKIYVRLVHYQNNNFVKKAPDGMICCPSLPPSLPFLITPSLNNIVESTVPFLCEWDSCGYRHISQIRLRWHVYLCHLPNNMADKIVCKWRSRACLVEGCSCPRDKHCLREHLMDHHYNDKALEQALYQRIIQNNFAPPPPPREKPRIMSNGESGKSAQCSGSWQQPEMEEKEEHVVNKSVRLTASLILKNFAMNSGQARRSLKKYEVQLAELAMSGYDCSGIISHILHYVNEVV